MLGPWRALPVRSPLRARVSPRAILSPEDTGPCLRTSVVVTTGGLLASVGGPRDAAQRPSAQHTPETPGPVSPVPRGRDLALGGAEAVGLSGFGVAVLAICGALGLQPRPRVLPRSLAVSRAPAGSSASGRIRAGTAGEPRNGRLDACSAPSCRSGPSRPHGAWEPPGGGLWGDSVGDAV